MRKADAGDLGPASRPKRSRSSSVSVHELSTITWFKRCISSACVPGSSPSPSNTKPSTDDGITLIRYRDGCVDGQGYHHLWKRRLVSTCTGAARPTFLWSAAYPHI